MVLGMRSSHHSVLGTNKMKKQHAKLYAVTPPNVASNAKPRHKADTKAEKKLEARLQDFRKIDLTKTPLGSYHCPGSRQK